MLLYTVSPVAAGSLGQARGGGSIQRSGSRGGSAIFSTSPISVFPGLGTSATRVLLSDRSQLPFARRGAAEDVMARPYPVKHDRQLRGDREYGSLLSPAPRYANSAALVDRWPGAVPGTTPSLCPGRKAGAVAVSDRCTPRPLRARGVAAVRLPAPKPGRLTSAVSRRIAMAGRNSRFFGRLGGSWTASVQRAPEE